MNYVLIFFLSFIITEISTPYIITLFKKVGIVDKPSARKIHSDQTPRMGGIIIYSVVIIIFQAFYKDISVVKLFFLGSIIIFICGIIDDLLDLDWKVKLSLQSISAILLMMSFIPRFNRIVLFGLDIPYPLNYIILFLFIVGTINSINLMDGLDGLTSGFATLAVLFIGFLAYYKDYALLIIITTSMLGVLLAFLKYNSFPAKIFLGDTGSLILGYFLVFMSIEIMEPFKTPELDLTFPVLLFGVPILDTIKVMFLRMKAGEIPFTADKKHLHHVIFGSKIRHKTTVFIIHFISILFMINALLFLRYHSAFSFLFFFLMGSLLLSAKHFISMTNRRMENFKRIFGHIFKLPLITIKIYNNVIIRISIIVFIILIMVQYRAITFASEKILLGLLLGETLLFILAIYQYKKNMNLTMTYVFFNLFFFFAVNNMIGDKSGSPIVEGYGLYIQYIYLPFFILAVVVFIFLFGRYSLLSKEYTFLNGMDLTLLSMAIMFFILQPFSQWSVTGLNYSLIASLVINIWFKILQCYYKRTATFLFFGLFLVNFSILLTSLLTE